RAAPSGGVALCNFLFRLSTTFCKVFSLFKKALPDPPPVPPASAPALSAFCEYALSPQACQSVFSPHGKNSRFFGITRQISSFFLFKKFSGNAFKRRGAVSHSGASQNFGTKKEGESPLLF
ncbi:hypothetical protein, partial [uncultured Mailhella sp.]|uniref:hypothetical protein n=1 Tax=uncultured Mailhella sp. TaxID=1981031 RepID=UPI002636EF5C